MQREYLQLHEFSDGYILEVIRDEDGDVTAITVEFDLEDPDEQLLAPRENLPKPFEDSIRDHLDSSDYNLAES